MSEISEKAALITRELVEKADLKAGQLLVVGCSSSEIVGCLIGHNSSMEAAEEAFNGIYSVLCEKGIYLAAQCCEHLNRALIVERELAGKRGYEIVSVVPKQKAGGGFAATAYINFKDPVAVEEVKAEAGLDIGLTLIGMHLKRVAVPLRLSENKLGEALITAARTRPKYIGGERAKYE